MSQAQGPNLLSLKKEHQMELQFPNTRIGPPSQTSLELDDIGENLQPEMALSQHVHHAME